MVDSSVAPIKLATVVRCASRILDGCMVTSRESNASAERDDRTWTVPLLDIEITADQHRVARLVAAYRRWLGIDR